MNIAAIDRSATTGTGFLHRCPVGVKLAAFVVVVVGALLTSRPGVLAAGTVLVLLIALLSGVPRRLFFQLLAYPLFFGALIALAAELETAARVTLALRALLSGAGSILLILTTPYPELFALAGRFLPRLLADTLLLTYRGFFLLAAKMDALATATRLRGSPDWRHPLRWLRALATAIGTLILYTLDLAQRDYDVLTLRGYEGKLIVERKKDG